MIFATSLAIIAGMAILARAAGGGLFATRVPSATPEMLFGLAMAAPVFAAGHTLLGIAAAVWSYAWMETGHGIAYHMGRVPDQPPSRRQTLSTVMDWLEPRLGLVRYSRAWCWVFMGIKGALIGVPAGALGAALLAILWPAVYDLGWSLRDKSRFQPTEIAEWLSGACAGFAVSLALFA